MTSNSAVAERPRDASCLSVVSFNSTIPRAQFYIIIYFGFWFTSAYNSMCSVVFGVTSSLAVIHIIHGRPWLCIARDRAWSDLRCTQSRSTVTAYSPWRLVLRYLQSPKVRPLSAINQPRCSSYRSQSQIFVENRDFSLLHLHSTPPVRTAGVPDGILSWRLVRKN